jgi:hypothetical protein
MKQIFTLFIIAIMVNVSLAQVRPAGRKHYEKFSKSTTYVVEDQDPFSEYNKYIKAAMEKHWTITPFEMISFAEFNRMRTREDASFMIFADIKQKNLDEIYEFINFVMGDSKREFESMPDLASVPLAYRDANDLNYLYKMGAFVKFMHTYVQERATPRMRLSNFMNVNDEALRGMELWLLENELSPEIDTEEKLQQHYPFKVKIVTREEIAEAIDNDREDVAFLHKIGPEDVWRTGNGKCWIFIVSAKDGRVLYSSHHTVDRENPDAILLSDILKMGR